MPEGLGGERRADGGAEGECADTCRSLQSTVPSAQCDAAAAPELLQRAGCSSISSIRHQQSVIAACISPSQHGLAWRVPLSHSLRPAHAICRWTGSGWNGRVSARGLCG